MASLFSCIFFFFCNVKVLLVAVCRQTGHGISNRVMDQMGQRDDGWAMPCRGMDSVAPCTGLGVRHKMLRWCYAGTVK